MASSFLETVMMQLISKRQLLEIVPFSHTHILRLENDGKFPKWIKPFVEKRVDRLEPDITRILNDPDLRKNSRLP